MCSYLDHYNRWFRVDYADVKELPYFVFLRLVI